MIFKSSKKTKTLFSLLVLLIFSLVFAQGCSKKFKDKKHNANRSQRAFENNEPEYDESDVEDDEDDDEEDEDDEDEVVQDTPTSAPTKPTKPKIVDTGDPNCRHPVVVKEPKKGTPEYVMAEAYRAALMSDSEAGFARFDALFLIPRDSRFRKQSIWPRLVKHVGKYVKDPKDFSFEVCSKKQPSGGAGLKVTVRSHDPSKSHPPSVLVQDGDAWKIKVFSY